MTPHQAELLTALDQNRRWLRTVVRSRLDDESLVDDVLQEVGVAILRLDGESAAPELSGPWLYRVAIHQVMLCRRSLGRQRKRCEFWRAARRQELDDLEMDPLRWVMLAEQREQLDTAIARLPGQDRELLGLKYSEGWTYRQISEQLGLPTATIQYRLDRARHRIRRMLSKHHYSEVSP